MAIKLVKHAAAAVRRRWSDRLAFGSTGSWILSIYDAAVRYAHRLPLPLRGSVRPLLYRGMQAPVFVRVGTSDAAMAEEIFVRDVYASVKPKDFRDPVAFIVDLGANCGMTLRLWGERFPKARVIAVEPDPENAALARRNGESAKVSAAVLECCVAGTPGRVNFSSSEDECAYHIDRTGAQAGRWVEARTMDMILAEHAPNGEAIDLLKCDIEGAEEEVFQDCRSWISRVKAMVIELHGKYDASRFLEDLRRNGCSLTVAKQEILYGNTVLTLRQPDPSHV